MKLYVRYKKDGKWTWRPATADDIAMSIEHEVWIELLNLEETKKWIEWVENYETEMS